MHVRMKIEVTNSITFINTKGKMKIMLYIYRQNVYLSAYLSTKYLFPPGRKF